MANDLVKRFIKKDGSQRISFYCEDYAENPRDMWDFPLHCEDWSRDYSIMNKQERETKSSSARNLIIYLLNRYGKREVIINMLVENGKHMDDGEKTCDNALVYDRSMKRWVLMEFGSAFGSKEFTWEEAEYFDGRKDDVDLGELLEGCVDSTIDDLCYFKYWTDGVKIMSYDFGYYGEMSFYREFSTRSEGIAWLEKDEALKDWVKEEYWDKEDCYDLCDGMRNELTAWSINEVYGFVVEDAVKYKTTRKCLSGNAWDEEYEETEWDEKGLNSCWGFYGELDKRIDDMFENAGLNKEEFEEENV